MEIRFLGGAQTVTGSQFLLTTSRAKVLIDCGMFQGSPNEAIRNRIPLGFEPSELDAILLTHAHLDHCGLIPHVVEEGFSGPIFATKGTVELATLVLLDSGRLQEEFAKRGRRWVKRHPDKARAEDLEEQAAYAAAVEQAAAGDTGEAEEHVATSVEPDRRSTEAHVHDPTKFGRRRFDAAWMVPSNGQPSAAESPPFSIASNPEMALVTQPPMLDVDLDEPLYDERAARNSLERFRPIEYGEDVEVAPGIRATFVDAGHILGSAIIALRVEDKAGDTPRRIVCSGDLGRRNTPILRDPTVMTDADDVLVETTYGGREHEPSEESVRMLAEVVRTVAESKGVLLVPSFAIGRTQEVVWELDRLIERGEIPLLPLFLDSPMASKATEIYRHHPDYYDEETRKLVMEGETPLDYPNQTLTNDFKQSQAIQRAPRPYMIVASNGMLTGGRVVGHLRELIDDPVATILFVGYQGEGTLGAHLQAGAKTVKIDGQVRDVRCRVRSISGFSAHADESELLEWLAGFTRGKKPGDAGFPRHVFLVHGDPEAQVAIEPKIQALGLPTYIPRWHESVELD
ncbi:MAG TPA: MBL fold metallo-hydrolase [Candidatus Polarisedimenticolia bacterium]|nr:MBL fold metallo-hydrolase [Candidatus Polarisedimenticolia bacterium]